MIADRIFGTLIDPDQRLLQHHADLSGVKHLNRVSPADPAPGEPFTVLLSTAGLPVDAARCFYTTDDQDPVGVTAFVLELQPTGTVWDTLEWGYIRHWAGAVPAQPAGTMVRYHLAAHLAGSDQWVFADNQAPGLAEATDFAVWVDPNPVPAWTRQAIVYHIFLDRFYPGQGKTWQQPGSLSGFFGGTLRGVIEKLEYVCSLGCNTLWLSPLFASPSHHGYDATDYYTVEPRLGTNADLRELLDSAHELGLRVILDFVANHWSYLHPTFQAAQGDPDSPYRNWYTWKQWPEDYQTYFGVKELPQLNLAPGPAREYLLAAARYWLEQGVDGYRLDYAYGPPHGFWSDFRRACRSVNPECWLFGEVVHSAGVQLSYSGRMDGTLDFLLAQALRETFAHGAWTLNDFETFLAGHEAYFPPSFSRPAFLDNHDMNRFLFAAGDDLAKLQLGALVLCTLSGPPIVYYGTESGVTQDRPIHQNDFGIFEEARLPMKWEAEANAQLLDFFRRLIALRRNHPGLSHGARRVVHIDAATGTYAYLREADSERILVALNTSSEPRILSIPRTELGALVFDPLHDQLNGHPVHVLEDQVKIQLPAQSGAWIESISR